MNEQTVANAEKGRGKKGISKGLDVLLRSLYLESVNKTSPVTRMLKRIVELDNHRVAAFELKRGRWYDAPQGRVA